MKRALFVLLLLALVFRVKRSPSYAAYLDTVKDADWYAEADHAARAFGVSFSVVLSLIFQESGGDEYATGSSGERGLMQLKAGALEDYNRAQRVSYDIGELYNGAVNVHVGTWYLAHLRDAWKLSVHDALLAYNSGIGNFLAGRIQNERYADEILERA